MWCLFLSKCLSIIIATSTIPRRISFTFKYSSWNSWCTLFLSVSISELNTAFLAVKALLSQRQLLAHTSPFTLPFTLLPVLWLAPVSTVWKEAFGSPPFLQKALDRYPQCRYPWQNPRVLLLIMQRCMILYSFLNPLRINQCCPWYIYCVFIQCSVINKPR